MKLHRLIIKTILKAGLVLSGLFLFSSYYLMAQERCATATIHQKLMDTDADYKNAFIANEALLNTKLAAKSINTPMAVSTIPVVVHVIHLGESIGSGTNISDAQVNSAITSLSDAFRKRTGTIFNGGGVDTQIEFCLATKDPNGNPTSGINRINGTGTSNYQTIGINSFGGNEASVKALSKWNNSKYCNIWVVSEIDNNNMGLGVMGFAYYPGASSNVDGVVIQHNAFGFDPDINLPTGYNLYADVTNENKVTIHEVGHYVNLYHTFEGDGAGSTCPSNVNGCGSGSGDCCGDTPRHTRMDNQYCQSQAAALTCDGTSTRGYVSQFYMSYAGWQGCENAFSADQSSRMNASLAGPRSNLVSSSNLTATGCNVPMLLASASISQTTGTNPSCAGESLTFTATAVNGGTTPGYQWRVNGVNVGNNATTYTASTLANGDVITCIVTSSLTNVTGSPSTSNSLTMSVNPILVPSVSIAVTTGSNMSCLDSLVILTATPVNGGIPAYQWYVNGLYVGTNSPTYSTTTSVNNDLVNCIIISNANCVSPASISSNTVTINVITPVIPVISENGIALTSSIPTGNQWYLNGSIIPGAINQTHMVTQNGIYTVIATVSGCPSPESAPLNFNTTGVIQSSDDTFFAIYPNPNGGIFSISFNVEEKASYKLEVRNAIGQLIEETLLSNFSGAYSKEMNIAKHGKGVYVVTLTGFNDKTIQRKVISY